MDIDPWGVLFLAIAIGPVAVPVSAAGFAVRAVRRGRPLLGWAAGVAAVQGAAGLGWLWGLVFLAEDPASTQALALLFGFPVALFWAAAGGLLAGGVAGIATGRGRVTAGPALALVAGLIAEALVLRSLL